MMIWLFVAFTLLLARATVAQRSCVDAYGDGAECRPPAECGDDVGLALAPALCATEGESCCVPRKSAAECAALDCTRCRANVDLGCSYCEAAEHCVGRTDPDSCPGVEADAIEKLLWWPCTALPQICARDLSVGGALFGDAPAGGGVREFVVRSATVAFVAGAEPSIGVSCTVDDRIYTRAPECELLAVALNPADHTELRGAFRTSLRARFALDVVLRAAAGSNDTACFGSLSNAPLAVDGGPCALDGGCEPGGVCIAFGEPLGPQPNPDEVQVCQSLAVTSVSTTSSSTTSSTSSRRATTAAAVGLTFASSDIEAAANRRAPVSTESDVLAAAIIAAVAACLALTLVVACHLRNRKAANVATA